MADFSKQVLVDARADMLLHGNLSRQQAIKLAALVEVDLPGVRGHRKEERRRVRRG